MALKDKAAMVDLSNIGAAKVSKAVGAKTAIGMHAEALFRDEKVASENVELKQRLAEFDGASASRKLDPARIKGSKWANRQEESFHTREFAELKAEIESAGGNIQPIKVRPMPGHPGDYELVFGHRRHRACLELGLDVLCVIEDLGDVELFCQMDRENRAREALRPYEAGVTYAKALDDGLFPSARKLAESASLDLSMLGKALALARLPPDILAAFPSPLDLQYRWATEITQAMQKDPERVLSTAKLIRSESPRPVAGQVLKRLVGGGGTVPPPTLKEIELNGKNGQSGSLRMDSAKKTIAIDLKNILPERFEEVKKLIQSFIA